MKNAKPPNYEQLHQFLLELGFTSQPAEAHSRVYCHADSDTLIVFGSHPYDTPARSADLISMRKLLIERGLIDARSLARRLKSFAAAAD